MLFYAKSYILNVEHLLEFLDFIDLKTNEDSLGRIHMRRLKFNI